MRYSAIASSASPVAAGRAEVVVGTAKSGLRRIGGGYSAIASSNFPGSCRARSEVVVDFKAIVGLHVEPVIADGDRRSIASRVSALLPQLLDANSPRQARWRAFAAGVGSRSVKTAIASSLWPRLSAWASSCAVSGRIARAAVKKRIASSRRDSASSTRPRS